jgi:Bacterial type II and III secretion system protein
MKLNRVKCLAALVIMATIGIVAPMRAQDKPAATQETKKPESSLKVLVVVTELDGAKKISSLPYTFFVNVDDSARRPTSVRVGLRVPIATGTFTPTAPTQFQYMDIGTNLDCTAYSTADNRYKLALSVEVSYLSSIDEKKTPAVAGESLNVAAGNPIVQRFTSSYNLLIRDGQTIEATSTTDPVSGRVLLISVTANAVK